MPPRTKLTVPAPRLERSIHEIARTTRRDDPTGRVDATWRVYAETSHAQRCSVAMLPTTFMLSSESRSRDSTPSIGSDSARPSRVARLSTTRSVLQLTEPSPHPVRQARRDHPTAQDSRNRPRFYVAPACPRVRVSACPPAFHALRRERFPSSQHRVAPPIDPKFAMALRLAKGQCRARSAG
jgi:hypothetical protein